MINKIAQEKQLFNKRTNLFNNQFTNLSNSEPNNASTNKIINAQIEKKNFN